MSGRETDGDPRRERVTLRLPQPLLAHLDTVADAEHDGNRSQAVRAALAAYVDGEAPPPDDSDPTPVTGEWPSATEHVAVGEPVREFRPDGGQPIDPVADRAASAWRDVGHRAMWRLVADQRGDFEDTFSRIENALREDRRIDETAVRGARQAIDNVRWMLEDFVTPLVADVEPWGDGAGATAPYGAMREQLESAGYTVERGAN